MNEFIQYMLTPMGLYIIAVTLISYYLGMYMMYRSKQPKIEELRVTLSLRDIINKVLLSVLMDRIEHVAKLEKLLKTTKESIQERDSKGRFVKKNQVAPSGNLFLKQVEKGQIVDKEV